MLILMIKLFLFFLYPNIINKIRLFFSIKSIIYKTIQKVKQIGSATLKKSETTIKTVYSDAKDIIQALLKTINNLLTSPTFMIGIGIAGIAAITVLPKVLK